MYQNISPLEWISFTQLALFLSLLYYYYYSFTIYIIIYIYVILDLFNSLHFFAVSSASFSDTNILNGSSVEVESRVLNTSSSEKSFIQQRVERLYGPGALAQGFFFKRSITKLNTSDSSFNKSSNNNDISADNANTEESLKNLPVLRHLRPEFRAQLPVVSSRKPTDGTEQVIKPLQRWASILYHK